MPTIIHPYDNLTGGRWLKGNLHAHTTHSDGKRSRQEVIDDYAARGYGFLMLSDHDIFTGPQEYAALDARSLILIPGNEVTANGPHLLHVNADRRVEPSRQRQEVLNAITGSAGFAIVNHPNWERAFDHCTIHQLREWVGYTGLEIYNGVISRLDGSPYATNKWDMLLSAGRRVWGFANDDSHAASGDVGLGWNVAYVTESSVTGVADALHRGRFYASTGVVIHLIAVTGSTVVIETENADRIVALGSVGQRLHTVDDRRIEFTIPATAKYVRFECWGRGEQFAWTQPFFNE